MLVLYILSLLLSGLIIGALGRLAIPGPSPMSVGQTIAVGIGGSLIGGILGAVLFNRPGGLLLSVAAAALIVWLMDRDRAGRTDRR